ncbi:Protein of unknown function [Pyronema omphalodes CBS 100304]|uniref:Uncharacterized protein n=1 Tax=Pyronema omphalodes (strain CBS 100304) TaxID=1076935 RepID=U4LAU7_PYROM|nr:Protein of unknown function [Pyronema omphalodes CBS 100304]
MRTHTTFGCSINICWGGYLNFLQQAARQYIEAQSKALQNSSQTSNPDRA